MKYVARINQILQPGIHQVGEILNGEVRPVADMPRPTRIEIEPEAPEGPFLLNRYTESGEPCGDTWHQTLAEAFEQAAFEYGLTQRDFLRVD